MKQYYEITSEIPAPPRKGSGNSEITKLLKLMHIGDSMLVPKKGVGYYQAAKKLGINIVTREVDKQTHPTTPIYLARFMLYPAS